MESTSHKKSARLAEAPPARALRWGLALALISLIFLVYWPATSFPFVSYDDDEYVFENPNVTHGLQWTSAIWAFTSAHAANWHPLTWLSHMLDCQIFGLQAGAHHAVNVALHVLNALLLFFFLRKTTRAPARSALCAALFALHPLRVESVAWIAERKDLLCSAFWWGTLLAYVGYVKSPTRARRAVVTFLCAGALLSKPMAVTLPIALLLVDAWPLGRCATPLRARLWEKVDLFALSGALAVVTLLVQRAGGAVRDLAAFPLGLRLENAAVTYAIYIKRALCPVGLGPIYPYPKGGYAWPLVAACALGLIAVTYALYRRRDAWPALWMGWRWYGIVLLPALGIIQVGYQASADRYAYLPLTGLLIGAVFSVPAIPNSKRALRIAVAALMIALLATCVALTRRQLEYWSSSIALFERAIAVTHNNDIAENELGLAYLREKSPEKAAPHFERALKLNPKHYAAWANMGVVLRMRGDLPQAARYGEEAVRLAPDFLAGRNGLGLTYLALKRNLDAETQFRAALERDGGYVAARINLALALAAQGKVESARQEARRVLEQDPKNADAATLLSQLR